MNNCCIDHNYFRSVQGIVGAKDEQDLLRLERRQQFSDDFEDSIGYERALRNDKSQDFIFKSTEEDNQFLVWTRPGEEINIGDILFWNSMHWLVRVKDFNTAIYNKATIVCCNRQISWQNPDTKEIITRWCLATKPYTSNVDEGNTVTLLHGRYDIELPYDAETIAVPVGKRFMLDIVGGHPMCYKMVFPDVNTNKYQDSTGGFIEWTLESDEYQKANDRIDLMICNYLDPEVPETETNLIRSEIVGRNEIKIGGSRQYTAALYDHDGNPLPPEASFIVWNLICDERYKPHFHIDTDHEKCRLLCDMKESLIGAELTLAIDCNDPYVKNAEIRIQVVSAFG